MTPRKEKQKIKQRITATAALRFRAEGLDKVGIANLMADLGLTHGGFYTYFRSKEDLIAQALKHALEEMNSRWTTYINLSEPGTCLQAIINDYLNKAHRDLPDSGCAAAAFAGELAHHSRLPRLMFSRNMRLLLTTLQQAMERDAHTTKSPLTPAASLALMVGAMMLARAIQDEELSDEFIEAGLHAFNQ